MKVLGLTGDQVRAIVSGLDMELDNFRSANAHSHQFRIVPHDCKAVWARRTTSGKRIKSLCGHGFQAVITRFFEAGAVSIKTAAFGHTLHSLAEFEAGLIHLLRANAGSIMQPTAFEDLCDCPGSGEYGVHTVDFRTKLCSVCDGYDASYQMPTLSGYAVR